MLKQNTAITARRCSPAITLVLRRPNTQEAVQSLPAVLQSCRLRPPIPTPGHGRAAVRPPASLALPGQDPRPRRLHRRSGHRSHHPHYPRELPTAGEALPANRARHEDQRARHHHQRCHRSSRQHPRYRYHLRPLRTINRTPPFTGKSHTGNEACNSGTRLRTACLSKSSRHEMSCSTGIGELMRYLTE